MNMTTANANHKGVTCFFCGRPTSLSAQAEQRRSEHPAESGDWSSIARCHVCGKEALYLPYEIIDLQAA